MRRSDKPTGTSVRSETRRCQPIFAVTLVLKLLLIVLSAVILALVDEFYDSYMIGIIIGVTACTLLYVAVSVMMEFFIICMCPYANPTCTIAEAVCSILFLCCWLLCCGIATQISLSAGMKVTEPFGWVGACAGLGCALFLALSGMYCLNVVQSMFYEPL